MSALIQEVQNACTKLNLLFLPGAKRLNAHSWVYRAAAVLHTHHSARAHSCWGGISKCLAWHFNTCSNFLYHIYFLRRCAIFLHMYIILNTSRSRASLAACVQHFAHTPLLCSAAPLVGCRHPAAFGILNMHMRMPVFHFHPLAEGPAAACQRPFFNRSGVSLGTNWYCLLHRVMICEFWIGMRFWNFKTRHLLLLY
jgi:hypothetical protein